MQCCKTFSPSSRHLENPTSRPSPSSPSPTSPSPASRRLLTPCPNNYKLTANGLHITLSSHQRHRSSDAGSQELVQIRWVDGNFEAQFIGTIDSLQASSLGVGQKTQQSLLAGYWTGTKNVRIKTKTSMHLMITMH